MIRCQLQCLGLLCGVLGLTGIARAAVLHVPTDFRTIQAAVDAAQTGDQILVSAGIYRENLIVAKSVDLVSESGAELTIIDGRQKGSVLTIGEQFATYPVGVSGFTLKHGYGQSGGGINQLGGFMTVENNRIVYNEADNIALGCGQGGGIYARGAAIIRHNVVARNRTYCEGGGIYIGSTFSSPTKIVDNVVENNVAGNEPFNESGVGGGFYVAGQAIVSRNVIRKNTAVGVYYGDIVLGGKGGGIMAWVDGVEFSDNAIYSNRALEGGGGIVAITEEISGKHSLVVNNTIVGNTGRYGSQVLTERFGSRFTFANNVIEAPGGLAVYCDGELDRTSPTFVHNDVYAGSEKAAHGTCAITAVSGSNLTVDPMLAFNSHYVPCRLAAGSPLIDAGSNAYARKQTEDLPGNPRIVDGGRGPVVDIGACEYSPER